MKYFLLSLSIFISSFFTTTKAQTKEAEKYRKESEDMRKQVWAWDKPQFKVRSVPDQYANASKVVLAHHTDLTADSRSKFIFYGFTFGTKKEETLSEVVREMVKINDKNAVADYSEISFTQFKRSSGFFSVEKTTSYVGVRIIKPDGSIKEINADDIVLTKDESTVKKAKVAIPDLQPGDIIDYFIATQQFMTNDLSVKPYHVLLFDDAPVLSLSFHAQLGKKFSIDYHSYNGAPELQVSKNDDKEIIVDVEKTNIPPFETSLWVAPGIQLPFIRMNIALGYKGMGAGMFGAKKPGEITKITSNDLALNSKISSLTKIYYENYWMRAARRQYNEIVDAAEKKAKQQNVKFKDMSDEEKAALLFYTFRFTKLLNFNIETIGKNIDIGNYSFNNLAIHLYSLLKAADVEAAIVLGSSRTGIRMNEAMDADELNTIASLANSKKNLSIESVYDIPFEIPYEMEGVTDTKALSYNNKATSAQSNISDGPKLPISSSDKNAHIEDLKMSLNAEKNDLLVHRSSTLKGYYKADVQKRLILYEDFYEEERKAFNDERSLIEELEDGRKSKKYVEEVTNAFAEARKKQKDAFISEAKDWFEQEITNLKDHKIDNLGVRHTAPDLKYSSTFNLEGLVKKAGNNIIVEIGKIQGQPLVVKQEQRKRDIDIYMAFARSIEYNIELQIPDGYSAEGIAALNKKVETEAGYFSAEATATDKAVVIKIKKHYLHNFEPAKNWDKLMLFMDAANEWLNAKLLLKKK